MYADIEDKSVSFTMIFFFCEARVLMAMRKKLTVDKVILEMIMLLEDAHTYTVQQSRP